MSRPGSNVMMITPLVFFAFLLVVGGSATHLSPKKIRGSGSPRKATPHSTSPGSTSDEHDPLIHNLEQKLSELRERKTNLIALERTIGSTEALIKEGVKMRDAAASKHARDIYDRQIRDSEKIHKDTAEMLLVGRNEAKAEANALLAEMSQLRKVEAEIVTESSGLLAAEKKSLIAKVNSPDRVSGDDEADQDEKDDEDSAEDDQE